MYSDRRDSNFLFAYLFFYYLATLIIFARLSRTPCILFLEERFKGN